MSKLFCETCDASDFLNPEQFGTGFDTKEGGMRQFAEGAKLAQTARRITIGENGVWGASMPDGSVITSYEKIGYHANTKNLLAGFLTGTAEVWIYRRHQQPTRIK